MVVRFVRSAACAMIDTELAHHSCTSGEDRRNSGCLKRNKTLDYCKIGGPYLEASPVVDGGEEFNVTETDSGTGP